jgi:3-deoxy-D-manno-octulosonate 8-phosphate phosphatase (KDO 8-P phosphatase)
MTLEERIRRVELLVLDVDGVLTDGGIIYTDAGAELKRFHVRDGSGLKLWLRAGRRAAVITGRQSPVVTRRAAELGLDPVVQGADDKLEGLRQVLAATGLRPEQACAVGDDLPDLPVLRNCGLAVAVADACAEVAADAHHVTRAPGGGGAVREAVEWLLKGQGLWGPVVEELRGRRL